MPVEPPRPDRDQPFDDERAPRELPHVRRRLPRRAEDVDRSEDEDEGPHSDRSDPVERTRGVAIEEDADGEERRLDSDLRDGMVPQPEAVLRTARPERKVGTMHEEVENPVADDAEEEDQRA